MCVYFKTQHTPDLHSCSDGQETRQGLSPSHKRAFPFLSSVLSSVGARASPKPRSSCSEDERESPKISLRESPSTGASKFLAKPPFLLAFRPLRFYQVTP